MPFYEYQCGQCGHHLEAMQKISDAPLKKCPHCGKSALKRLMSAPVFRLKGGGWYETDFKSDQDKKRNLADSAEADAPKEDKPAEKKEGEAATAKDASKESGKDSGTESGKDSAKESGKESAPATEKSAKGASNGQKSAKPEPKPKRSSAVKGRKKPVIVKKRR